MLQTDRRTLSKIGGEDKTLQTDRRNPQAVTTVVQKRYVIHRGSQLWSKNVTSPTRATTDLL